MVFSGVANWDDPDEDQWSRITQVIELQKYRQIHPGKGPIGSFAVLLFKGSQIPDPI